jgi:hypothetical protein
MKNVNLTIYFNRVRGNMFFNKKHTIVGIQLRNDDADKYFINIENGTIKLEEPFTNPSKLPYQHHMYKDGINDTDCLLFLEWLEGLNGKEIDTKVSQLELVLNNDFYYGNTKFVI